MAMFCRTGLSMARERRAETMVTPALGPSFGVAPWGGILSRPLAINISERENVGLLIMLKDNKPR